MPDIIKKFKVGFTQVPNWVLSATDISMKAKGLYAYLFSKPDGWQFYFPVIEQEIKESKGQFLAIIKELVDTGYITRRQYNENGRFGGMIYEFIDKSHIRKIPCTEKSVYGLTPSHNNIDNNNNTDIISNIDIEKEKNKNINIFIQKETENSICENSQMDLRKTKKRKDLQGYGEFNNVKLTKEEVRKLIKKYGWYFKDALNVLSSYLEAKGDKYKNHYAVLCENNWVWEKVHNNQDCGTPSGFMVEDKTKQGGLRRETIEENLERTMGIVI